MKRNYERFWFQTLIFYKMRNISTFHLIFHLFYVPGSFKVETILWISVLRFQTQANFWLEMLKPRLFIQSLHITAQHIPSNPRNINFLCHAWWERRRRERVKKWFLGKKKGKHNQHDDEKVWRPKWVEGKMKSKHQMSAKENCISCNILSCENFSQGNAFIKFVYVLFVLHKIEGRIFKAFASMNYLAVQAVNAFSKGNLTLNYN